MPGTFAEIGHHSIGLQTEQIINIQLLCVLERPPGQAHGGQRQGTGNCRNRIFYLLRIRQTRKTNQQQDCG